MGPSPTEVQSRPQGMAEKVQSSSLTSRVTSSPSCHCQATERWLGNATVYLKPQCHECQVWEKPEITEVDVEGEGSSSSSGAARLRIKSDPNDAQTAVQAAGGIESAVTGMNAG